MSRPGEHWPSAAVRLRSLVDRFALGLLVGLSVLLLLLGKADIKLVGLVGDRLTDGVAPALAVLNRPVLAVRSTFDGIANILAVYEENGRLREHVARAPPCPRHAPPRATSPPRSAAGRPLGELSARGTHGRRSALDAGIACNWPPAASRAHAARERGHLRGLSRGRGPVGASAAAIDGEESCSRRLSAGVASRVVCSS